MGAAIAVAAAILSPVAADPYAAAALVHVAPAGAPSHIAAVAAAAVDVAGKQLLDGGG